MKTLKFSCTLKSDIIINQRSATEGNQETLDFIPGSNFLGISASIYNELKSEDQLLVFHSGKVIFGDAHPAYENLRTLRIPASMYYPKLQEPIEDYYIHHQIDFFSKLKDLQLKQGRNGFYGFKNYTLSKVNIEKTFAIKSAYDRDLRRSEESKMYGYQSIDKGTVFYFTVSYNENEVSSELVDKIKKSLIGAQKIGRSRTAQYGLVKITEQDFEEVPSIPSEGDITVVYADSRLIFFDDYSNSTFQPKAEQLGIPGGEIIWEKSQIRTFQYAPWNFKRQARDTDRCGIEKGSIFVVQGGKPNINKIYWGKYLNEGFGKIIYNPDFLKTDGDNGKALYKIVEKAAEEEEEEENKGAPLPIPETDDLLCYLQAKKKEKEMMDHIYLMVNDFVSKYSTTKFRQETFASQWGAIRRIAMTSDNKRNLENLLFAYLTHGVAKEKWEDYNRLKVFREFFDNLTEKNCIPAIINLASEMAKRQEKPQQVKQ